MLSSVSNLATPKKGKEADGLAKRVTYDREPSLATYMCHSVQHALFIYLFIYLFI